LKILLMGKINNTNTYGISPTPNRNDILLGSKADSDGKTVNFEIGSILDIPQTEYLPSTRLISGGMVWVSGLTYESVDLVYSINNVSFTIEDGTQITLSTAPSIGTNKRIDIIYCDNEGLLGVVEGIESETPITPNLDISQLQLNLVLLDTNVVAPPITEVLIYAEDAGQVTEWDATENTSGTNIDLDNTTAPIAGTKSIRCLSALNVGNKITFTHNDSRSLNDFSYLKFKIKLLQTIDETDYILLYFNDGISNIATNTITLYLDKNNTTTAQDITILKSNISGGLLVDYTKLVFQAGGSSSPTTIQFLLDEVYIYEDIGAVQPLVYTEEAPIDGDAYVRINGGWESGSNHYSELGHTHEIADITDFPTSTSQLVNDGEDGVNPFVTQQAIANTLLATELNNFKENVTYNYTTTGAVNLNVSSFYTHYAILTGNTTVTLTSTIPSDTYNFTRILWVKSTANETFSIANVDNTVGSYLNDGTWNKIVISAGTVDLVETISVIYTNALNNPETAASIGAIVNGATNYVTPLDADKIGIWDAANSLFKAVTWANIKATLQTAFNSVYQAILTAANFGDFIIALTSKTTPVDADSIVISDSAATDDAKKVSLTNFKAYLKTYNDTLYAKVPTSGTGTVIDLSNTMGHYMNMSSANSTTTYTKSGEVLGGFAVVRINAASQPIITGGTLISGASFIANTDMHMFVQYFGVTVQYFFAKL
jgi:hypothetical protein